MDTIIQPLISGIAMGFIYSLIAIEYTLVFNTSGLMNFGHEKYIMMGAFVYAGSFILKMNFNNIVAIVPALAIMFLLGIVLAIIAFNPLRNLESIYAVAGTLSMSMIVLQLCRIVYGSAAFNVPPFVSGVFQIDDIVLPKIYVLIIIVAAVGLILHNLLLTKTRVGKAMRAISQDKEAATLMGINVSVLLCFTVGLSLLICCIIGILLIPMYGVSLNMTSSIGTKGFVAGIIGGFGSINGAIVGGLLLGFVEAIYLILGGPGLYKDMLSFALIVIFLLWKPQGLLNKIKL